MTRRLITMLVACTGLGVAIASESVAWRAVGACIAFLALLAAMYRDVQHQRAAFVGIRVALAISDSFKLQPATFKRIVDGVNNRTTMREALLEDEP